MKKLVIAALLASVSLSATAAQTIRFATEASYPPFESMDASNKIVGFDVDLANALCKEIDATCTFNNQAFDSLIPSLKFRRVDAVMAGMDITPEREKQVLFTKPYYDNSALFIGQKGKYATIDALKGKKVGVQAGSALLARLPELKAMLEKTGGKLGPVVEYQSYPEAYADLANKRLDYVINVVISVNDLVKQRPKVFAKGLPVSGPGYMGWPIPKSSPQLLEYMTKFMNHMRETGKLKALQMKWFGETYDDLPTEPITSAAQFHKLTGM